MPESTFTFRVDEKLKTAFSEAARRQDRAGSQILREFMRRFVRQPIDAPAYDAWFKESVHAAFDDPRPAIPSAIGERRFAKRRRAVQNKYGRRPR